MSYGLSGYGISGWGGSDFDVINHIPVDNSTNVSRTPIISFTLSSQSGNVVLSSINLTANGISLIINGVFTSNAIGIIDNTNPANVNVSATVTHSYGPLSVVVIVVDALNTSNSHPAVGVTWQFTVSSATTLFQNYIVRKFERVFRINSNLFQEPTNPHAEAVPDAPTNLTGKVV